MAGKNGKSTAKAKTSSRSERADFVGYVNITLSEEDRVDFLAWMDQGDLPREAYLEAYDAGYQFSFKFDRENDAFGCSVSRWDVGAEDSGIIYTARSSDPEAALWKAVYVLTRKLSWSLANGFVKRKAVDSF